MVLRSRLVLFAVTMAAASFLAACGGEVGSGSTTTGTGGSGGAATTGTTGGSTTAATTSSGTGGTTPTGCQSNADCALDPNGPICNSDTGECVSCIPIADNPVADCGVGSWCVPTSGQCESGCTGDADCPSAGSPLICDLDTHTCVGCVNDDNCPAGAICLNEQCLPGCTPTHACTAGQTCCGQQCFNLADDENNCGSCNNFCEPVPNADVVCLNGQCQQGVCNAGFSDCNGDPTDGCETNTLIDGQCVCDPGAPDLPAGCDENLAGANCICQVQPNSPLCICYTDPANPACTKDNEKQSCYLGAPGSQGVGPCKAGTRMCKDSGLGWGACTGQVLPQPEICANNIDENCDGIKDNAADMDNDGWTSCEGDCDDTNALVNPGALEVTYTLVDNDNNPNTPPIVVPGGNGVDDDCDPATSDLVEPSACGGSVAKLTGVTANDIAQAMDLCQSTTLNPPKPQKKWGLLSAAYKLGSGADPSAATLTAFQNDQTAIMVQYGYLNGNPATPNNTPKKGPTMAGISSGRMRYTGQANFVSPNGGWTVGTATACPAAYLAAHGGSLPSTAGCNGNCTSGNTCNDSLMVRLQVRVPTNAKSMSYNFKFYSGEFPEWVCTTYNDFYLALLTTGAPGIPVDKNVSFDSLGNAVSVNNGFFDVCSPSGCFNCPQGVTGLAGTGMDSGIGGGTSWLTTDAPVVGGETITLDLIVFDVGDTAYDSNTLLDYFRWGLNTTTVKTHE